MNSAHLHLLLNHVPVLGAFGVLALLAIAFVRRDSPLARLALGFAAMLAAASVAVFLTGEPAEEIVERLPGIAETAIEPHEEAALIATIAFGVFGAAALVTLIGFRRRELPRWVTGTALSGMLVVSGLMGYTANLGGMIRHTEIGSGPMAPGLETWDEEEDEHQPRPPGDRR